MRIASAESENSLEKKNVSPGTLTSRAFSIFSNKRLVFRLSSTPKRLLENSQWRLCLGAIMEFTAAGQSEIHTRVPN